MRGLGSMDYKEFKLKDAKGLYSDYTSVAIAKRFESIPIEFHEIFKDYCDCGSEFIINRSSKSLMCCDPGCKFKLSNRLSLLYSNFGISNLGDATCFTIIDYCMTNNLLEIPSHIEVLKIEKDQGLSFFLGARYNTFLEANELIRNTRMTFGSLVRNVGMPMFSKSCDELLSGLSSIGDLIQLIKDGELESFMVSRGVYSVKKIEELKDSRNLLSILEFESCLKVPLIQPSLEHKTVCITGKVVADGYNMSRPEFVQYCTELGYSNGIQFFTVTDNKALTTTSNIIADSPSNTRTYMEGLRRESNGEKGVLVTAQEYVDMLREEVKLWIAQLERVEQEKENAQ